MPFRPWLAAIAPATVIAALLAPAPALAQTITWSQQALPERILPDGGDLGISTRPAGLNPDGINYEDCASDQTLTFYLYATGFTAGQTLGAFASLGGNCTNDDERNVTIDCWPVAATVQDVPQSASGAPVTVSVRVRDIVAHQNSIPQTNTFTSADDPSACNVQTSTAGSTITVWFVPLSGTTAVGNSLTDPIATDLVGPPPPAGVKIDDGDGEFTVVWTPGSDTETLGYDIYLDDLGPIDGGAAGSESGTDGGMVRVCNEGAGDAEISSADATAGTTADGSTAVSDAGQVCHYEPIQQTTALVCNGDLVSDPALSITLDAVDAGTTTTTVTETDAGEDSDASTTPSASTASTGGNSGVDANYLVAAAEGLTAAGVSTGSYTVTNLTNNHYYAVAVSAVDAFGNIGPPSTPQACDYPAPVNDFYSAYRNAGGGGGGGFCALEAAGAPVGSTAGISLGALAVAIAIARRRRRGGKAVVGATIVAASLLFAPASARAQTIAWSQQTLPDRILPNGSDLGVSTRPPGLNPDGLNFQDCITDQTLRFYLLASGFTSGQNIAVYATVSGNCTNDPERNTSGMIDCWYLGTTLQSVPASVSTPITINVRVQDLVAFQNSIPQVTSYQPQGAAACSAQTTTSGASLTIWFVPLTSGVTATGTALSYPIATSLVGPAPPAGVNIDDGDSLMVVKWTPNSDTVTQGYNVYIHALGSTDAGFGSRDAAATLDAQLVCNDEPVEGGVDSATTTLSAPIALVDKAAVDGAAEAGDDADALEASAGASSDATVDGASPGSNDAASAGSAADAMSTADATVAGRICYMVSGSQNTGTSMCTDSIASDPVLSATLNMINTTASSTVIEDDAGTVATEEAGSDIVGGGNSGVDPQYLLNASAGQTVSGESSGSYTVTGVQNGTYYAVAVSAVDAFGNVGPPSTPQACDYPAPVKDFWTVYKNDGGGAGGGFCALEAVGAPVGSTVAFGSLAVLGLAVVRRRRRSG